MLFPGVGKWGKILKGLLWIQFSPIWSCIVWGFRFLYCLCAVHSPMSETIFVGLILVLSPTLEPPVPTDTEKYYRKSETLVLFNRNREAIQKNKNKPKKMVCSTVSHLFTRPKSNTDKKRAVITPQIIWLTDYGGDGDSGYAIKTKD